MRLMDLMEPEETVGNLWHDVAKDIGAERRYPAAGIELGAVRPSLAMLFRALGGAGSVEIVEAPATPVRHRQPVRRRLGAGRDTEQVAAFDGARLLLPPVMDVFPSPALNRAAYFWLTALAALNGAEMPPLPSDEGPAMDHAQLRANARLRDLAYQRCPGLRESYAEMAALCYRRRPVLARPSAEAMMEQAVLDQLGGQTPDPAPIPDAGARYMPIAAVPIWLRLLTPQQGPTATVGDPETGPSPAGAALSGRKAGERRDLAQTRRRDSFIIHRFESILSWVEALDINRSVDDDDQENAAKAAEDQDKITLTRHDRKAATRLRLHLDLSPAEAEHEALAGVHTYPEWNHKSRSYMEGHVRVLEAPSRPGPAEPFHADPAHIRAVRRQFEALHPRRILRPRQIDGAELDLEAVISGRADLVATGAGTDRIWQNLRKVERDLSVAFLIDTSRSTEAAIGETCVIDTARNAMAALAEGLNAAGDRFGIWGFSSLRRDRVFLTEVKPFAAPMGPRIQENIAALSPGHYTRLGAAIRHVSARLATESATHKLIIVLTDGKPNDLDHYEGQHGIEDSRMAVRDARRGGQSIHGVIIDEDGQDWFARIFGRGGFTLLPRPERLLKALPEIYRTLTQET